MDKTLSRWAPSPKQKRSQKSLQRLLDSARKMLNENSFEQASVQMIVKDANSSIGSFYNHFTNKEALLNCLLDQYEDQLVETVKNFSKDEQHKDLNLSDRFRLWLTTYIKAALEEKGLLKTRILFSMRHPEKITEFRKLKNAELMVTTRDFFLPAVNEIKHPDQEKALNFIISMIDKAVAYKIFLEGYEDHLLLDMDSAEIVNEFVLLFSSYLGINRK